MLKEFLKVWISLYRAYRKNLVLYLGIFLGFLVPLMVFLFPYTHLFFILWIVSIGILGFYFFKKRRACRKFFYKADFFILLFILIAFLPLYHSPHFESPIHTNLDEFNLMDAAIEVKEGIGEKDRPRLFYMEQYVYYPQLHFFFYIIPIIFLGDINVENLRFVVSSIGMLSIAAVYFLFRVLMSRLEAVVGAVILGISHMHLGVSRIAIENNMAVLITIISAFFFMRGWLNKCYFNLWMGGIFAGLGWFTHFNGRLVLPIIGFFIFIEICKFAGPSKRIRYFISNNFFKTKYKKYKKKSYRTSKKVSRNLFNLVSNKLDFIKLGSTVLLASLIVILPMIASSSKTSDDWMISVGTSASYLKSHALIFEEPNKDLREYYNLDNRFQLAGLSLLKTLRLINFPDLPPPDNWSYYINPSNRLLDFVTGIFFWIGLISVFLKEYRNSSATFFIAGLCITLLFFSFGCLASRLHTKTYDIFAFRLFFYS